MSEKTLLDFPRLGTLVALFSITAIGLGTCAVERWRVGNWKNKLNWVPTSNTYIYLLRAGEFTEKLYVRDKCYRFRTYPADNKAMVYWVQYTGQTTPRRMGCATGRYACPVQRLRLANSGYLFFESARASKNEPICSSANLANGWAGFASPVTSAVQKSR